MKSRGAWGTRYGFYFAAVGSAFGLGNLWRFPYIVGSSGGGAFVLIYIFTALFVGLPILIAELILGKVTQQSVIGALYSLENENRGIARWLHLFGRLAFFASVLLLSYYAVVSGWVLHFVMQFFLSIFQEAPIQNSVLFRNLMTNGWLQIGLTSIHILFCTFVVAKGVQQGIERWIGFTMPLFGVLLVYLTYQSLMLSGAEEALRFLFYPDFSKVNSQTLLRAIGHSLFTLSLGFGAMVTFGSYLRPDAQVPSVGFRVALLDTVISLCVGVLIFPIVFSANFKVDGGATILFETVPLLLRRVGLGEFFGITFFTCAYLAAFGASVGLLESSVSNLVDRKKMNRTQASWMMGAITFMAGLIPALSSSALKSIRINDMSVLQNLDSLIIHWLLPFSSIGISIAVGTVMKMKLKRNEFILDQRPSSYRLFSNWVFLLRWVIPIVILGAMLIEVVDYFLLRN